MINKNIMITLNLISPDYKKTIKVKKIFFDMENFFLYILFITIISAIVLLAARKILEDNFVEVVGQTSLISRNPEENRKNIQTNKKIKLAKEAQENYIPWSRFIISFRKLVPESVMLESLNISPDNNGKEWAINLAGVAVVRDNFLNFKKKLLNAKELFDPKDIEIPIENLFEKENIKFNIKLKITKEVLMNLKMPDNY